VILNIDGQRHVLEMESYASGRGKDPALSRPTGSSRIAPSNPPVKLENIRINRARLDESLENMHHLAKGLRIVPHIVDGKTDGLRLSRMKSRSIFREMGLKNGDVIKAIDGRKIESARDAVQLYKKLQSSASLKLQLTRWGKEKTIQWHIEP
jgi:general secretion pathway protein C